MAKARDLSQEGPESLQEKLATLKKEIYGIRGERGESKGQKTHLIRQKKKEIARILTVQREKELGIREAK